MASSILDNWVDDILDLLRNGYSNEQIVAWLHEMGVATSEASIRRLINKPGNEALREAADVRNIQQTVEDHAEAPGVEITDDQVLITLPPGVKVEDMTTDELLARHDLDPEEWEVERVMSNQWEANAGRNKAGDPTKIVLFQFKVHFKRKTPVRMVFPIIEPKFDLRPPKRVQFANDAIQRGIITTDHHAPHKDETLHWLTTRFLKKVKMDFGLIAGDLLDNSMISRHRDDPKWDVPVQEGLQAGFNTIYDYRNADEDVEWTVIPGNHDDRIRNELLERCERLYGITAAQWPGEEKSEWVMSLRHLLNLDRLGVNYHFDHGSYEFQQVNITSLLAARHGHKTGKDAPLKTVEQLGHSIVIGHTHKQSVSRKTLWNSILNTWNVVTAIEAGCMCEIEGGIGYASGGSPDWQPGFVTVSLFPDGSFTWDHAIYSQDGHLRWRDLDLS